MAQNPYVQYQVEYVKKNYKQVMIKFQKENEKDLIDYLQTKDSMQAYIKDLIRKDMEKEAKKAAKKAGA